ncbi:MAG: N-acetylmuramoyl-L-alanine amidase [Acidobacteria bacterium]|nr:N-acetylmuramoyl-L-alanine amidase [Acidobacteriota bacterium]
MKAAYPLIGSATAMVAAAVLALGAQSVRTAAPYTLLAADGRRTVAAALAGDQEMLRLEDLATALHLTVREDRSGNALTVSRGGATAVLSLDQGLASINGRLVSLPAAPVRDGSKWLVPPEAASRAFALIADARIEVRKASRLIVVGDLRVPRLTIRQEAAGAATRVMLDLTPRTNYAVTQEPRRLLVRFEADGLDATSTAGGGGLVESFATAEPAILSIHLAQGFGSFRTSTLQLDAAASRVVIDLMPAGAAAPPQAQPPAPPAPPPIQPPAGDAVPPFAQPQAAGIRTIVLDPGHGGDELGARGPGGTVEKDLTLDVSRRLKSLIEGRLGIRVLLTRDDDRLVPLDERAPIANNNKADLFISIHANASLRTEARGAEVFYLSLDGYGDEARRVAEDPPSKPLPVFGGGSRDIDLILWDMAQARHLEESSIFAGMIQEELRRRVDMSTRPIQQAPFRVLVSANMPAVLVEMAFISNPQQETELTSDDFKNRVVQALYDAILRYRARIEGQTGRRP